MSHYHYRAFGLRIASGLILPELSTCDFSGAPDLEISVGGTPEVLEQPAVSTNWLQLDKTTTLFKVPRVGKYLIREGREIVLDLEPGLALGDDGLAPDARLYLLGMAMMCALYQRGVIPYHISAVETSAGAIAFSGDSGDGKSTTAAWLYRQLRTPILCDDVALLQCHAERVHLLPGPRRLKLWQDALNAVDIDPTSTSPDMEGKAKHQILLCETIPHAAMSELRYLFVLNRGRNGQAPAIRRLGGAEAFAGIMGAVHRPALAKFYVPGAQLMEQVAAIGASAQVFEFTRPWALDSLEAAMEPVLTLIKQEEAALSSGDKVVNSDVRA
jgi:hypothetical protein